MQQYGCGEEQQRVKESLLKRESLRVDKRGNRADGPLRTLLPAKPRSRAIYSRGPLTTLQGRNQCYQPVCSALKRGKHTLSPGWGRKHSSDQVWGLKVSLPFQLSLAFHMGKSEIGPDPGCRLIGAKVFGDKVAILQLWNDVQT